MYAQTIDKLGYLHAEVGSHLAEIAKLFTQQPKITIVIRTPWLELDGKDGGVILTDDDFDLVIAEINRLRTKPLFDQQPTVGGEGPIPPAQSSENER